MYLKCKLITLAAFLQFVENTVSGTCDVFYLFIYILFVCDAWLWKLKEKQTIRFIIGKML